MNGPGKGCELECGRTIRVHRGRVESAPIHGDARGLRPPARLVARTWTAVLARSIPTSQRVIICSDLCAELSGQPRCFNVGVGNPVCLVWVKSNNTLTVARNPDPSRTMLCHDGTPLPAATCPFNAVEQMWCKSYTPGEHVCLRCMPLTCSHVANSNTPGPSGSRY